MCRVERIDSLHILTSCRKRQLNQVLSVVSLSIGFFIVFSAVLGLVYVKLHLYVFVFWLFCLSCHYLPSDWLEILLRGSLFVVWRLSSQSPGRRAFDFFGLMYFVIVWLCI